MVSPTTVPTAASANPNPDKADAAAVAAAPNQIPTRNDPAPMVTPVNKALSFGLRVTFKTRIFNLWPIIKKKILS